MFVDSPEAIPKKANEVIDRSLNDSIKIKGQNDTITTFNADSVPQSPLNLKLLKSIKFKIKNSKYNNIIIK